MIQRDAADISVALIVHKNLYFFLLGNQHFLFPLACTCYISEWESASESLFLRNVFKGQILGSKQYITITAPPLVWRRS